MMVQRYNFIAKFYCVEEFFLEKIKELFGCENSASIDGVF
jgi:hypothetical protein